MLEDLCLNLHAKVLEYYPFVLEDSWLNPSTFVAESWDIRGRSVSGWIRYVLESEFVQAGPLSFPHGVAKSDQGLDMGIEPHQATGNHIYRTCWLSTQVHQLISKRIIFLFGTWCGNSRLNCCRPWCPTCMTTPSFWCHPVASPKLRTCWNTGSLSLIAHPGSSLLFDTFGFGLVLLVFPCFTKAASYFARHRPDFTICWKWEVGDVHPFRPTVNEHVHGRCQTQLGAGALKHSSQPGNGEGKAFLRSIGTCLCQSCSGRTHPWHLWRHALKSNPAHGQLDAQELEDLGTRPQCHEWAGRCQRTLRLQAALLHTLTCRHDQFGDFCYQWHWKLQFYHPSTLPRKQNNIRWLGVELLQGFIASASISFDVPQWWVRHHHDSTVAQVKRSKVKSHVGVLL